MKHHRLPDITAISLGIALMLVGCRTPQTLIEARTPQRNQPLQGNYTIVLHLFTDEGHSRTAQTYKIQTERRTGWKGLFVLTTPESSRLCWGKHKTIKDAEDNLKQAVNYVAPAGVKIYDKAVIFPLEGPDVGPPEWKLENARGVFSVMVAIFYNVSEANYFNRKQDAVEYCSRLRKQGKEAYYYHDPSRSAVTVGGFPEGAISDDGEHILDGRMRAIVSEFRYLAVNGRKDRLKIPSTEKRDDLRFGELKRWGATKDEAQQTMKAAAEGYRMVDQSPYPVRIPRKSSKHAPTTPQTDHYPRYTQPW